MVTDYNEHVEINNLYDDPDKNEVESIFSTFDIGEYWQYVKKTAVDEADMLRHSELAMLELEEKSAIHDTGKEVADFLKAKMAKEDQIERK